MSSYFYSQAKQNSLNADFLDKLEEYADQNKEQIYVVDRPLGDQKYNYNYSEAFIILAPKNKIAIINYGSDVDKFEDFIEDIIEDIGSISDKYLYKDVVGRSRTWRGLLFETNIHLDSISDISSFFNSLKLNDDSSRKKAELLISLFTGSINDIERVKGEVPETILDKVKQKIQLFDGDQTRFVYEKPNKKIIRIQGLSGTGKTELLLHKLKELYTTDNNSRIFFTCHNKILADKLKKRIPSFFNFMKVEQQIEWESRLWCTNAWGATKFPNSGAYRYICAFYQIPFYPFSYQTPFSKFCSMAIDEIKVKAKEEEFKYAFDYMLIDESQDFDDEFFELCQLVTEGNIYVAGDIFQSIFDREISSKIEPDYLLGKCYRTDPRTLMFAHALGMGLFEEPKLRWLEEKEWRDCGYNVFVDEDSKFHLSREPLRRFEDIDSNYESMEIISEEDNLPARVVRIIKQIIRDNSTVKPDDIGIILLDQTKDIFKLADVLEIKIQQEIEWKVNKAYESKEDIPGSILISNRNNVKGLEFPFIICISKSIQRNPSYRNALYTMLTRSFIKTYLVVPNTEESGLTIKLKDGLKEILTTKKMIIDEPSEEEKLKIKTTFEYKFMNFSRYDLLRKIFAKLKVEKKYHESLFKISEDVELIDNDEETLTGFVRDNLKYIKN